MAASKNNIDDQNEIDDFVSDESTSPNDIDLTLSPADGHVKVTGNCQKREEVIWVPAEQQFEVQSDRQVQPTDSDIALVPAEQQFGVQSETTTKTT